MAPRIVAPFNRFANGEANGKEYITATDASLLPLAHSPCPLMHASDRERKESFQYLAHVIDRNSGDNDLRAFT